MCQSKGQNSIIEWEKFFYDSILYTSYLIETSVKLIQTSDNNLLLASRLFTYYTSETRSILNVRKLDKDGNELWSTKFYPGKEIDPIYYNITASNIDVLNIVEDKFNNRYVVSIWVDQFEKAWMLYFDYSGKYNGYNDISNSFYYVKYLPLATSDETGIIFFYGIDIALSAMPSASDVMLIKYDFDGNIVWSISRTQQIKTSTSTSAFTILPYSLYIDSINQKYALFGSLYDYYWNNDPQQLGFYDYDYHALKMEFDFSGNFVSETLYSPSLERWAKPIYYDQNGFTIYDNPTAYVVGDEMMYYFDEKNTMLSSFKLQDSWMYLASTANHELIGFTTAWDTSWLGYADTNGYRDFVFSIMDSSGNYLDYFVRGGNYWEYESSLYYFNSDSSIYLFGNTASCDGNFQGQQAIEKNYLAKIDAKNLFNLTSITAIKSVPTISVFYSLETKQLHIITEDNISSKFTLYNLLGQTILNTPLNNLKSLISVNNISGPFFWRVEDKNSNIIGAGKVLIY